MMSSRSLYLSAGLAQREMTWADGGLLPVLMARRRGVSKSSNQQSDPTVATIRCRSKTGVVRHLAVGDLGTCHQRRCVARGKVSLSAVDSPESRVVCADGRTLAVVIVGSEEAVMAVSEDDLAAVLDYCRALAAGADQLELAARDRDAAVTAALVAWRGPLARAFAVRSSEEAVDLAAVVRGLRDEADDWARVWADTVNAVNRARHDARVEEFSGARSMGERLVDVLAGDDSDDQVRPFIEVAVPTTRTGYAPTGGLERF